MLQANLERILGELHPYLRYLSVRYAIPPKVDEDDLYQIARIAIWKVTQDVFTNWESSRWWSGEHIRYAKKEAERRVIDACRMYSSRTQKRDYHRESYGSRVGDDDATVWNFQIDPKAVDPSKRLEETEQNGQLLRRVRAWLADSTATLEEKKLQYAILLELFSPSNTFLQFYSSYCEAHPKEVSRPVPTLNALTEYFFEDEARGWSKYKLVRRAVAAVKRAVAEVLDLSLLERVPVTD